MGNITSRNEVYTSSFAKQLTLENEPPLGLLLKLDTLQKGDQSTRCFLGPCACGNKYFAWSTPELREEVIHQIARRAPR